MNESNSKPKEINLGEISRELHSLMKKIRDKFYELLIFIENESKKKQNNEILKGNNILNNNIENEINNNGGEFYYLWNINKKNLGRIKLYLSVFNNNNYEIKFDNSINNYFINENKANLNIIKLINDLSFLIYKDIILINHYLLIDYINEEKNNIENKEKRMRINYYSKLKIIESKSINDYIYDFIKNNFKDLPYKRQDKDKEIQKEKDNINFNCEIKHDKSIIKIKIEFSIFNIIIKIPFEKEYNLYDFLFNTFVRIKYKYSQPYNPNLKILGIELEQKKEKLKNNLLNIEKEIKKLGNNIHLEKEKLEKEQLEKEKLEKEKVKNELELEKILLNIKILEIKKDFIKKEQLKDNYLLIKFKRLIENRIKSIIKIIFKESENDKTKIVILNKIILIEFCKRFIYYIHDYNDLFKKKCAICQKICKYSFTEKCFYPPYIKIYKERNIFNYINNNVDNANLFYHEECIRKINLPNL